MLYEALGVLDDHLGHLWRVFRLIEGGVDDFALHRAHHIGYFFRALIDEQDDKDDFRTICRKEFAIFWSRIVLPARGGETMRPRWPFPMGVNRSMTRALTLSRTVSSFSRSCG